MIRKYPVVVLLLAGVLVLAGETRAAPQDDGGEMLVSAEICADCHEDQAKGALQGPHAVLDEGWAEKYGASFSCAACHGDPTEHLESGGGEGTMLAFEDGDLGTTTSSVCLECHSAGRPRFHASPHFQVGMACTDCHSIHDPNAASTAMLKIDDAQVELLDLDVTSAACATCHEGVLAQFEFNERHRLQDGAIACVDCHDPHGPATRMRLGGFKQQACIDCHTDKGGPFVFEHGSSRVDGCVACHDPHGSPNRHMLAFQSTGELCYSCHAFIPGFHARFTLDTVCTNCHSTIHGSNFDPFFLK